METFIHNSDSYEIEEVSVDTVDKIGWVAIFGVMSVIDGESRSIQKEISNVFSEYGVKTQLQLFYPNTIFYKINRIYTDSKVNVGRAIAVLNIKPEDNKFLGREEITYLSFVTFQDSDYEERQELERVVAKVFTKKYDCVVKSVSVGSDYAYLLEDGWKVFALNGDVPEASIRLKMFHIQENEEEAKDE